MSKVIDFVVKHMDAFIISGTIVTIAGAAIGASLYNKEKDRKLKASLPDSYWDAQARSAEAESNAKIEIAKIKSETELQKAQDEYEAMKSMPEGYFDMKKAEIMRDASVKAARIDADARAASAREQRLALNNAIDSLTKESK